MPLRNVCIHLRMATKAMYARMKSHYIVNINFFIVDMSGTNAINGREIKQDTQTKLSICNSSRRQLIGKTCLRQ